MMLLLAAKSVLIAGGTLLLIRLMPGRSASDRSFVAHLGLAALAALPLASLLLPALEVSARFAPVLAEAEHAASDASPVAPLTTGPASPPLKLGGRRVSDPADWLLLAYGLPALLLIGHMMLALVRLVLLTARARRVTDDWWCSALARAQRRIRFTKDTALLATGEIASPVSWGMLRPKILLNSAAVASRSDAEAIVTHELAHIVRWDWAKLVLARVSVALFWFNPFAWLLAREAHQLREEAADDAVLASAVDDTTYASLLVSTARAQSSSPLFGVHGIAPARNSLARRVRRVLDASMNRSASGHRWSSAMALSAAALALPLASVQFTVPAMASSTSAPNRTSGTGRDMVVFAPPSPAERAAPAAASAVEVGAATQPQEHQDESAKAGVENGVIDRILLKGSGGLNEEEIRRVIDLAPGEVLDPSALRFAATRLLMYLERQGAFGPTVKPQVVQLDPNRVEVVFEINKGRPVPISQINIEGNEAFSDEQLRTLMVTTIGESRFRPDRLAYDQQVLRQFYLANGYPDFRVVSAMAVMPLDRDAVVTFVVDEGRRQG